MQRLQQVLARNPGGLELRNDPASLAPERLLVFKVRGSVQDFANAINKVPGLELVDEEELESDDEDKAPALYLLIPNVAALGQLLSLWTRWQAGEKLPTGFTPWQHVFELLRELRPWGPNDRVTPDELSVLEEEVAAGADDELIALEIELVFRENAARAQLAEQSVTDAIVAEHGNVVRRSRISEIAYHALLARVPVRAVRAIIERAADSLAGIDEIMHIRPQSLAPTVEIGDVEPTAVNIPPAPNRSPILALIDGAPVAGHPLLANRLVVDDPFGIEPQALVEHREHGSAMASVIVHGDLNRPEQPLPRRIHVVPVLLRTTGLAEEFPRDQLIVDLVYQAIIRMREGVNATAPDVVIVNLSLGNVRRSFQGQMSAWARLIDRLAWRFGILFVVSAGNFPHDFEIPAFKNSIEFENAIPAVRAGETITSLHRVMADRRIISPAETVNGITVGAANIDAVADADRRAARMVLDPYPGLITANPSSRLGPGLARSIKPDILMPGAREHLRVVRSGDTIWVKPTAGLRPFGIKVATPPHAGDASALGYTCGTSAAAAFASRTCHRIYDTLEANHLTAFGPLSHARKATLLKALLVHPARWPEDAAELIGGILGPHGRGQAPKRKDNVRRFLGYGSLDPDDAVACAADRATFWASGTLAREQSIYVDVPIPACLGGQARPHEVIATVAWLTPIHAARRSYRSVRLSLRDPTEMDRLAIESASDQPDANQVKRGTVISRRWAGDAAPVVVGDMSVRIIIQREPDASLAADVEVPFGIAVTITMPGVVEVYEQARVRLRPRPRIRPRG